MGLDDNQILDSYLESCNLQGCRVVEFVFIISNSTLISLINIIILILTQYLSHNCPTSKYP